MKYGTGLQFFSHSHPERFFDVGMAEQHAVTFAAGLASQGMLPVVAIYSTFLQRSYDQLIHDVNLLKENVLVAIDRAGLVPADGETHQGIYDPAFLSEMEIPLYSPSNYEELRYWLYVLTDRAFRGPRAIRYPRGGESARLARYGCSKNEFDRIYTAPGAKAAIVSYASEVEDALQAADLLQEKSTPCDVYKLVKIYPFTEKFLTELQRYSVVLCAEECVACGCIGEHLLFALHERGWTGRFISCAVQSDELPHATVPEMKQVLHLSAAYLTQRLEQALEETETV
jgi:1-deoxy-D-xylulose-5-phosphate synthase